MASTRGPQVLLEGYARDVARGGAGRTMRDNIAAMDALQSAGLVADGSTVDGTSRTGGQAYDAVVAQFPHEPLSAWEIPTPALNTAGVISVPPGGSIQAAHDALPATGGSILLATNTTYIITAPISFTKPNVTIQAPSWGTVIQRGGLFTGNTLQLNGIGCLVDGMTFDGNNIAGGNGEVQIAGADSRMTNVQVINPVGAVAVAASGINCRVDHCTVKGISQPTNQTYGIWAQGHVPVTIDHNTITGMGVCGIGADGPGTIIEANNIGGCDCYTGIPGAQLLIDSSGGSASDVGITVSANYIGTGGANGASAIEVSAANVTITGNTIINQMGGGIFVHSTSHGILISANTINVTGLNGSGSEDGIVINTGVTDFSITGNRISDDQATPTMRAAINVTGGASDRYAIVGNILGPCTWPIGGIIDNATGINRVVRDNTGLDTNLQGVGTSATVQFPPGTLMQLIGAGTVTAIGTQYQATGRTVSIIPFNAIVFQAGNNIANTVTCVPSSITTATFDGSTWHMRA